MIILKDKIMQKWVDSQALWFYKLKLSNQDTCL